MRKLCGNYFCGNEASDYAKEVGYLDYATLAKAFDAVMCNDIITRTNYVVGEWEQYSGAEYCYEDSNGQRYDEDSAEDRRTELREALDSDEGMTDEARAELQEDLDALEEPHYKEFFQYFIISGAGAEILKDWTNECVWYNEELDMYVWGVDHYGTSWDYVLTDIRLNCGDDAFNED